MSANLTEPVTQIDVSFFTDETHEARGDKQSFTVACKSSLRPKSLYLHCQMPKPTTLDLDDMQDS